MMDKQISDSALSSIRYGLLQPTSREQATRELLEYVKCNKKKLPLTIVNLLSQMLPDKNIEIITRRNIAIILTNVCASDPKVMSVLDENLGCEDIEICKIIMGRLYHSDYHFKNVSAIEHNIFNPDLKLLAISLTCKASIEYKQNLQITTIAYLNQSLHIEVNDNASIKENECIFVKYILAIFINQTNYLSDIKVLGKLILIEELRQLIFVLLNNISMSGRIIDFSVLIILCKISTDKNVALKIREYLLNILQLQVRIHDNLSNFKGFSFLTSNFHDENMEIIGKTIQIFIFGLEKENMLYNSTELKGVLLKSNSLNRLKGLLKEESLGKKIKDDITLMLLLSKDRPEKQLIHVPRVEKSEEPIRNDQEEKSIELLLNEIADLNKDSQEEVKALIKNGIIKTKFYEIEEVYNNDSVILYSGKKISEWIITDVQNWLNQLTVKNNGTTLQQNLLAEIIAVVKRVNYIIMNQQPRPVQILSILLLLLSPKNKGRLLQISTGEGKSTTVAMLAAVLALQGESVDIITSSPILAKRDAAERHKFFSVFNLTATHNIDEHFHFGPKQCYKANIVYGDVGSFQYDLLRHEYKGYNTRGNRNFQNVIIDEVDSMLIDDNSKLARLASHIAGTEYLEPLLVAAWFELVNLQKHLVYTNKDGWLFIPGAFKYEDGVIELLDEGNEQIVLSVKSSQIFCKENVENYLTNIIQDKVIVIPSHLEEFALSQVGKWAESAFQALHMVQDKHYIITKNKDGNNVIAPVDYYNTGIVQENTKWNNGLHQFLQLKHGLKLTAEDFNTSFISNLGYFKRYGHSIFGVTGTLGSKFISTQYNEHGCGAQDLLTSVYPIDLAFVPTFKKKIFTEIEGKLIEGDKEWLMAVTKHIIKEGNKGKAVLVICETISNVKEIEESILEKCYPPNKIKRYSRSDNDECLTINDSVDVGEVIIATNLAGRGTDIKTSEAVETNGGLHVCITFMPDNLRVEEQAFGRTSRQGKNGTAIIIVNKPEALLKFSENYYLPVNNISDLKELRNATEYKKLLKVKEDEVDKIETDDLLFSEFCKFTQVLRQQENNKYKLMQLDEHWGLWLKQIQEELHTSTNMTNKQRKNYALNKLEIFKNKIGNLYYDSNYKIMQNPAYLIMEGFNSLGKSNHYNESINLFSLANNLDKDYSFSALYNRAYAYIREGYSISVQKGKFDQKWQYNAKTDLLAAKQQISETIIPRIESMAILFHNPVSPTENDLFKQVVNKIDLLKLVIKYIECSINTINNCKSKNIVCVNNIYLLKELFNESAMPYDEIHELNAFGIYQLFDVKEIKPQNSGWALLVFVMGVAQIALGALSIAVGFETLGVALISEGIQDIYKSIQIALGKPFNMEDYFLDKAITLATALVQIGIETVVDKIKAARTGTITSVTSQVERGTELAKTIIKEVAIKTAINIGADILTDNSSRELLKLFKNCITKAVNSKIIHCFNKSSVKQNLTHILATDTFNCNHNFRQMIYKIVSDILSSTRNIVMTVATKIMQIYSSVSRNTGFKSLLAENIVNIGRRVHDLHELNQFISKFCDSFMAKLNELKQKLPKINDILYEHMKPIVNMNDVNGIIGKLTQGSVVCNNELVQTNICSIYAIKFDEYEDYRKRIIDLCERLHATLFIMDYSQDVYQLREDVSLSVRSQLSAKLQGQLMFPIMREVMDPVCKNISEKLVEASTLAQNGIKNIQTSKKFKLVDVSEMDVSDTMDISDEEFIEPKKSRRKRNKKPDATQNNKKQIENKQNIQPETQLILRKGNLEKNIFDKPALPILSLHGITPAELLYNISQEEKPLALKNFKKLLHELEQKEKFQKGFKKEVTIKKINEITQMIERSEKKCNFNQVIDNIQDRYNQRTNRSILHKTIDFFKPSLPFYFEDIGDLAICVNNHFTRWSDENFTDFKSDFGAYMNIGVEKGITGIEYIIGERNVKKIGKFIYTVDKFLDQNFSPGERGFLDLSLSLLPINSVATVTIKKAGDYIVKSGLKNIDTVKTNRLTLKQTSAQISSGPSIKTTTSMGQTGQMSDLNVKQKDTIKAFVESFHNISSKTAEGRIQLNELTDYYQKQFLKYQRWNVNNENAYWKYKVVGNAQTTHTNKHARVSAQLAIDAAKDSDVLLVSMNQGVKKILGLKNIETNFRPDVIVIRKRGLVQLYEVRSVSDSCEELMTRMITVKKALPGLKVTTEVKEIPGVKYKPNNKALGL